VFATRDGVKLAWYENSVLDVINQNRESFQDFANLFLYLSIVLALFSIFMLFNYISTSIVARRQSIGVLRALGSNSRDIFRIFFTESIIISVINGILACVVSAVGCIFVNMYIKTVMGFTLSFAVYSLRQIVLTLIASLVTGILASLLPIIKICKEKPVDLIRKP
jgi:ABC-type antimicrobial peptide transport system permease subunit